MKTLKKKDGDLYAVKCAVRSKSRLRVLIKAYSTGTYTYEVVAVVEPMKVVTYEVIKYDACKKELARTIVTARTYGIEYDTINGKLRIPDSLKKFILEFQIKVYAG